MQKQAQKPKQKRPTRRSMTFSGCFTCRARGVKCDEQRPVCQRCVKAKRECAGYGVRLQWEDRQDVRQESQESPNSNKSAKTVVRSQRRSLPWAYGPAHVGRGPGATAALGDHELDAVLAALPEEQHLCHGAPSAPSAASSHPHARLFAVFAATSPATSPSLAASASGSPDCSPLETSPDNMLAVHDRDGTVDPDAMDLFDDTNDDFNAICNLFVAPWLTPTPSAAPHLVHDHRMDDCRLFPSPQPSRESRLLDYWVNHTSSIMVSIPRRENPFRTIFVPMALAAQSQLVPSAEYKALLHGIYAMVAFNYAQRQSAADRGAYNHLGMSQHQLSVAHLQRSLRLGHVHNPEVVLATIILLTTTNCITSNSTAWRTCVRLGRQWILSSTNETWRTRPTASTLYQIFLVLEAVGTSANVPQLPDAAACAPTGYGYDYTYNSIFGLSCTAIYHDYQLDHLFGITQPMFEAMVHMNQLVARADTDPPSPQELDNLRVKILLNDPRARRTDAHSAAAADDTERRFLRHHAYLFYFACRIHYERVLLRAAPHTVQHLVRGALGHLAALARLQTNLQTADLTTTVMGLTWPVLVVACEADDPDVQKQVGWYFDQGQTHGVWSISSARRILAEVWRRRRSRPRDDHASVSWQEVMRDLGLDLLLT